MTDTKPEHQPSKYDIANEFVAGMACAIMMTTVSENPTTHWLAGWRAGRSVKHECLNQYLVSIGVEPMGIVKLARTKSE